MNAVEDSLRRLGTDYIDLYYIHHVDVQTPLEEMLRAFDDLVRQGKVRYTACSNYEAWRLMEGVWLSDSKGLARFAVYQPQYSLVVRDIEEELVPACALKELGMVVWSPLAGGYLSGKYQPGEQSIAGSRSSENWAFPTPFFHPDHQAILANSLLSLGALGAVRRKSRYVGWLNSQWLPAPLSVPEPHSNSPTRSAQLAGNTRTGTRAAREGFGPAASLSPRDGRNDVGTA